MIPAQRCFPYMSVMCRKLITPTKHASCIENEAKLLRPMSTAWVSACADLARSCALHQLIQLPFAIRQCIQLVPYKIEYHVCS